MRSQGSAQRKLAKSETEIDGTPNAEQNPARFPKQTRNAAIPPHCDRSEATSPPLLVPRDLHNDSGRESFTKEP